MRTEFEGVLGKRASQNEGTFAACAQAILIGSKGYTQHSSRPVSAANSLKHFIIKNCAICSQKFRETELRIRYQLDVDKKDHGTAVAAISDGEGFLVEEPAASIIEIPHDASGSFGDYPGAIQSKYLDDASDVTEESIKSESLISLTVAKEQYAEVLQQEMEDEFNRGLLISKQQYDQLRYEDAKIVALRNAKVRNRKSLSNYILSINSL